MPFGVSPVVNNSNAELLLLLSEHRGKKIDENVADLLVVVHVVMLVVLPMAMMTLPLVMVYSAFEKKKR